MPRQTKLLSFIFAASVLALPAAHEARAAGGKVEIERQDWTFSGPFGQFDQAQLQRGFQVYQTVCAACHGIERLHFRNLVQPGGPAFPEDAVKALAAEWVTQTEDGPNEEGEMYERPSRLSDAIPGPYKNEMQARAAQNGALPPDLSLITKARMVEYTGSVWYHPIYMLKDILTAYQEGGVDYLYALLTGYKEQAPAYQRTDEGDLLKVTDAEAANAPNIERCASVTYVNGDDNDICVKLQDGMNYNTAFPGHQLAMIPPLADGVIDYAAGPDGEPVVPETKEQYARDVTAFLAWAAEPTHDQRKRTGMLVLLYLLITTVLLYLAKTAIWKQNKP